MSDTSSFVHFIVGTRKSGKTVLLLKKLTNEWKGKFDLVVIVSTTWTKQAQTKKIGAKNVLIFNKFHPYVFKRLLEYADEQVENGKNVKILLVIDDTASSYRQMPHELDEIVVRGRHSGISVVILCQRLSQLTTTARSQMDSIDLFALDNPRELKFIYQEFGSSTTLKEFQELLKEKTKEQYTYFTIRNNQGKLDYK